MSDLYWSETYSRAFVEALNRDPGFQKAARKFDDTLVMRCLDSAEGLDVEHVYRISKGTITLDRTAEPAPHAPMRDAPFDKSKAMARTTAPYAIWVKLDKGEMSVLDAIRSPDYRVEGPKLKIMKSLPVLNAMSSCGARMTKRYE